MVPAGTWLEGEGDGGGWEGEVGGVKKVSVEGEEANEEGDGEGEGEGGEEGGRGGGTGDEGQAGHRQVRR